MSHHCSLFEKRYIQSSIPNKSFLHRSETLTPGTDLLVTVHLLGMALQMKTATKALAADWTLKQNNKKRLPGYMYT
jgi:hypothetical protein